MRLGLGLGINKGRKNSGGFDPSFQALLNEGSSQGYSLPTGDALTAGNQLVLDLKSAGVWDKLDLFYVFATNGDSDFAKLNWITPGTYTCTVPGTTPTFTSLEGFTGNSATDPRLSTNYTALTNSVNYTQDSASIGMYIRSNAADAGYAIYGKAGAIRLRMGNQVRQWLNSVTDLSVAAPATATGWYHFNRPDASNIDFRINNVADVRTNASSDIGTGVITLLADSTTNGTSVQMSIAFLGGSLASEATDFYNAVVTYMTAIGKNV